MTGQEHAGSGQQEEYNGRYFDAEPEGFPDSVVFAGAVIEPADRLKALAKADQG